MKEIFKNLGLLTIVALLVAVFSVGLLSMDVSAEGIAVTPVILAFGAGVIMLSEWGVAISEKNWPITSTYGWVFHTIVFILIISIAKYENMLDGYNIHYEGINYYGYMEYDSEYCSASEWLFLAGAYALRSILQIGTLIVGIHTKRKR